MSSFVCWANSMLNILQDWVSTDDCEDVVWEKCETIPKEVEFTLTVPNCTVARKIPWTDCKPITKMTDIAKMECQVKHDVSCKPVTRTKTKNITYELCKEIEAPQNCTWMKIQIPVQVNITNYNTIMYIISKVTFYIRIYLFDKIKRIK